MYGRRKDGRKREGGEKWRPFWREDVNGVYVFLLFLPTSHSLEAATLRRGKQNSRSGALVFFWWAALA